METDWNYQTVCLITGYLGAGKTTLLRRIIESNEKEQTHKKKIAVLMNEFGEIGIDGKVVEGKHIRLVELPGGCICCSLAGEFEHAIGELLGKYDLDWIVIETTGVAEPSALAFDVIKGIKGVRLDAIVTIADADSLIRFPDIGHTGKEQLELADLLLLNKIDLVDQTKRIELKSALSKLNKRANIVECDHCMIDMKMLFGFERIERSKPESQNKSQPHTPETDFEYFDFVIENPKVKLDFGKFYAFLGKIPNSIYRSKGFVRTDNGDYLMNYVAGKYSFEEFNCERTEIVFIGKKILGEKEKITQTLTKTIIK